jgi:hypothetical protein
MTWEALNRKIWKMWKRKYSLGRISRELSKKTGWSGYYSLCYALDFLHNKKGIGFSRKQLRYAFRQFLEDVEPDKKEAWAWVLYLGGFKFERGKKSRVGESRKGAILSYSRPKMADIGISPGEEYKDMPQGEKIPEMGYLAPERGISSQEGDSLQEVMEI